MIAGFIFDYGGTLDTGGRHWGKVLWQAYQDHHVGVTERQFREAYVYAERTLGRNPIIKPDFTFRQTLEEKLNIEMDRLVETGAWTVGEGERRRTQVAMLDDLYRQVVATTTESHEVLTRLGEHYPLVLVSNFYGNIHVVLREFGLDGLFTQVIESAVVGIRKPDSRIFMLGVETLGLCPHEVVVVGDSLDKDIIPAHEAGCQTVWLKGEGWTNENEYKNVADVVVYAIKELLQRYI